MLMHAPSLAKRDGRRLDGGCFHARLAIAYPGNGAACSAAAALGVIINPFAGQPPCPTAIH